jgi:hypothetical protein
MSSSRREFLKQTAGAAAVVAGVGAGAGAPNLGTNKGG